VDNVLLACHDDADRIAAAEAETTPHAWSRIMYASSLGSSHDRVWLCQDGQQIQGAAVLMQVLDEAHLQNFFIHSTCQGLGLGSQLLQHVMQQARQQGASHGFARYAQRKAYYRNPDGQREDAVLMKVSL